MSADASAACADEPDSQPPAVANTEPWWADLGERLDAPSTRGSARHVPRVEAPTLPGIDDAEAPGPERVVVAGLPHLPDAAWIAALLLLDDMGPARLGNLLRAFGAPRAWRRVLDGSLATRPEIGGQLGGRSWPALVGGWQRQARAVDVEAFWARHVRAGVGVAVHGGPAFPCCLAHDPEPPAALFHLGNPAHIPGPRVAIVGTRRCSARGRKVAEDLGFALSRAGVSVVSGLARGIDGGAHLGALRGAERGGAAPIGVVASGLDVVYPHDHADLWARVAAAGVLLSEVPLGVKPNRWRFPARNRVIAGMSDAVVVVESPATGGSMYTVEEALRRDVPVLAVPGAVGLRAGEGTNALIYDGAGVVRDAADVLLELGLPAKPVARPTRVDARPQPSPSAGRVLTAMAWQPCTLADLVARLHASVGEVVEAVAELREGRWIEQAGAWLERVAP